MRQHSAIAAIGVGGIVGVAIVAAAWELAARVYNDPLMMPRLDVIAGKARVLYASSEFHAHARASLVALLRGYVTAAVAGILLGLALAQQPLRAVTLPIVSFLAAIPFVAAAPLLAIWYGLNETAKVYAVALAATFPIARAMMVWFERHAFALPASQPDPVTRPLPKRDRVALRLGAVVGGLRQGLAVAVATLVTIEFVASTSGLGTFLISTTAQFDVPRLLATFIAIALPPAVALLILDSIERGFERRLA
jgi:ABC-type nitrate/sulfonate/bicarbonate transport system permease component